MTSLPKVDMDANLLKPLEQLEVADPECAEIVRSLADLTIAQKDSGQLDILIEETLWALTVGPSFGRCAAKGFARIMGKVNRARYLGYRDRLREAGANGVTLGCLMAEHLSLVLSCCNDQLLDKFLATVDILLQKGIYAVKPTLETLKFLIASNDHAAAASYLDLAAVTFLSAISYNRSIYFTQYLPRKCKSFPREKRIFQIKALIHVMEKDQSLFDPFIEGLEGGLGLLGEEALDTFVTRGLDIFEANPEAGARFLSLSSQTGIKSCERLQTSALFFSERPRLARYLKARIGKPVTILPISDISSAFGPGLKDPLCAVSDGASIYFPDEIDCFAQKSINRSLYMVLAKLEAGLMEFGTFSFDLERLFDRYQELFEEKIDPGKSPFKGEYKKQGVASQLSDMELFWEMFPSKPLAQALFTLFEHARITWLSREKYSGLVRQVQKMFGYLKRRSKPGRWTTQGFLFPLYETLAIKGRPPGRKEEGNNLFKTIAERFYDYASKDNSVLLSGIMVIDVYREVERFSHSIKNSGLPDAWERTLIIPMGRQLRPDLFYAGQTPYEKMTCLIYEALKKNRIKVYKTDLRQTLADRKGQVTTEDIAQLIIAPHCGQKPAGVKPTCQTLDLSWLDLKKIMGRWCGESPVMSEPGGKVFRYWEWNDDLNDYLKDHVRVVEKKLAGTNGDFYGRVLSRHRGLVKTVKRSFEMLRPEGLLMLRPWMEGDDFDYRALLDYAIDRKAGLIPSDRLYIKRLKQQRDVATLVLVDVSRSTANCVGGTGRSVLDVEKEALVIFCEALDVLDDAFAAAGFSGTGRLGVDYYPIKDFSDPVDDAAMERIGAMAPRRSTRMGAAIRHGTSRLEAYPAKVKLMIIIGDGFPNDLEYKGAYAIADTRKAILEARSKNIHVKAVTVNISDDIRLDNLYGDVHHTVISDVRELPDRLLHVYGRLTKN